MGHVVEFDVGNVLVVLLVKRFVDGLVLLQSLLEVVPSLVWIHLGIVYDQQNGVVLPEFFSFIS